jgi:peptidoglycan/LPS O-acetylase OafA/YrhL
MCPISLAGLDPSRDDRSETFFLVLSGYFITASLRRARDRIEAEDVSAGSAMRAFYCGVRFLRIFPAYAVFATVALLLNSGTIRHKLALGFLLARSIFSSPGRTSAAHPFRIFGPFVCRSSFIFSGHCSFFFLPRKWMMQIIIADGPGGNRVSNWLRAFFSVPLIARWVLPFGSLDSHRGGLRTGVGMADACGPSRAGWLIALRLFFNAGAGRRSCGTATRMQLRSVLWEPLEAGAFVVLVARTGDGFEGWWARVLTLPGSS